MAPADPCSALSTFSCASPTTLSSLSISCCLQSVPHAGRKDRWWWRAARDGTDDAFVQHTNTSKQRRLSVRDAWGVNECVGERDTMTSRKGEDAEPNRAAGSHVAPLIVR